MSRVRCRYYFSLFSFIVLVSVDSVTPLTTETDNCGNTDRPTRLGPAGTDFHSYKWWWVAPVAEEIAVHMTITIIGTEATRLFIIRGCHMRDAHDAAFVSGSFLLTAAVQAGAKPRRGQLNCLCVWNKLRIFFNPEQQFKPDIRNFAWWANFSRAFIRVDTPIRRGLMMSACAQIYMWKNAMMSLRVTSRVSWRVSANIVYAF